MAADGSLVPPVSRALTVVKIDAERLTGTLADLVGIPSVNPAFSDGTTNESAIASHIADVLSAIGMDVRRIEPEPGRASVVGCLKGSGGGRSLMLYGHIDTVGITGMTDPFRPRVDRGRLYGRGSYDMKGGVAACIEAARAIAGSGVRLHGDLLVVGVADEEAASMGMEAVLREVRCDGAIVTEPTELDLCLAHKGFVWIEVTVEGRAAHGSRWDLGTDANVRMGRFLVALEQLQTELRSRKPHPLVGPPSVHAGLLRGGTAESVYAAESVVTLERRTLPGETEADALAEVQALLNELERADPAFRASARITLSRSPLETSPDSRLARLARRHAEEVLGRAPGEVGVAYWMDAALIAAAGIETVCIGPAGAGAHADEEWVDLGSVVSTAEILARTAVEWCGAD